MIWQKVLVGVVVIVLFLSLLGANVAIGLDRGPLNADTVKNAAEDAELYASLEATATDRIGDRIPDSSELPVDVNLTAIAAEAVTEAYIQNQSEANIDRLYAYLNGQTEELTLAIDTRPLKDAVVRELVETVTNASVSELGLDQYGGERLANLTESKAIYRAEKTRVRELLKERIKDEVGVHAENDFGSARLANLSASQSSYQAERERFRDRLKTELKNRYDVHPENDFGNDRLANLSESQAAYQAEREAFRDRLKEELKDRYDVHPENDFGNQRLANLSENQSSYQAERARFKEKQKQKIQNSTDRELTDGELEQAYQDQLPEIRDELRTELEDEFLTSDTPDPLQEPISSLINLTIEALTTDMTYATFSSEYATVKSDFEAGLDATVEQNMDEFRDELRTEIERQLSLPDDAPPELRTAVGDLVNVTLDALTTDMSYDTFSAEYAAVKEQFDDGLDAAIEDNMDQIRAELRSEIKDRVTIPEEAPPEVRTVADDLVNLTLDALTTEMAYDEFVSEYDTVKAQFDDALDAAITAEDGQVRAQLESEVRDQVNPSSQPEPLQEPLNKSVDLVVTALTSNMSYAEFDSRVETIKGNLARNAGEFYLNEYQGGLPDRMTFTDDLSASQKSQLRTARQAVSTIGLLSSVLPVIAILLIAGLYAHTRSGEKVAVVVGVVAFLTGAISAAAASVVPQQVAGVLEQTVPAGLASAIDSMIVALFAPLWTQSLVLLVLGIVVAGAGLALRFELVSAEALQR